ncbi:undecaprenyldiphospho-muramoylpentapeptide beta-N-acetylglucosaminyltransferase [Alkalicoccus daliensis]|uniref:UDP-N-acetylglucosamine--N-acetylmuramyl-(pentapeptide) pyrophosphoryl-undecaprenol N-acetylglucosamine transferase n=1 Tax=Alkalicoccus daliensis TaxID=745820 RepID=A0A1G9ZVC6_9BACI|nr:undecaprenyldiphospho-muramoylpentapeptide beta-N-acetylglucosaminyltransferase [Alkalicoccus daliensis]SDN25085.1 UDP-N-acetylglucosamine-N-acetylmuramylpentapeptide N-acetylglucosamine transferase [Alkalicoccus daliensis]
MKVLVSGGGTGGHIYPALALVRHLAEDDNNSFLYIGTEKGLEATIVPKAGIPFKSVHITGFRRKISFENVKTVLRFLKAVKKAKKYIKEFQPDVVVGTGGYVCGPVVYAAAKANIPTLIHEQNSVPGLTNKFLSKYVDKVAISFEDAAEYFPENKTVLTGNPRASEVTAPGDTVSLKDFGLSDDKQTILIVGGSRGAKPINEAVLEAVTSWEDKPYQVVYVTGEVHFDSIKSALENLKVGNHIVTLPYVEDMPSLLKKVDMVIARAGATSLAEITALGLPSILVPSPYVTNNHQFKNAKSLVDKGAAILLEEKELNAASLTEKMDIVQDPEKLGAMKNASLNTGKPEAADLLEKELISLTLPNN